MSNALSSSLVIRPGSPSDADRAIEIENSVWAPYHYEAEGAPDWDYDPRFWVVAELDGRMVATADGCLADWDGHPDHLPASWTQVMRDAPAISDSPWTCALGTSIVSDARGLRLSALMLEALAGRSAEYGAVGMLAPARPSSRASYPHLDLVDYANLRLADGRHADPWIRTHERLGARIIGHSERSMDVSGTHAQWEAWLGYPLPQHTRCLIPGSTGWLELWGGMGRLSEDSIWMLHPISSDLKAALAPTRSDDAAGIRAALLDFA